MRPDYFPAGDSQLTATCTSNGTPPFMATLLTLPSSQIPTPKVDAEMTGSSAQSGSNAFGCALRVTLPALALDTVFSVDIRGGGFANPSGGDSPQVTAFDGCPSPYYPGNGGYNHYDVNISAGGCTTAAAMTLSEAVMGAADRRLHSRRRCRGPVRARPPSCCRKRRRAGMAAVDPAGFSG